VAFHADADDRRSAAVNRLAKWLDRAGRWDPGSPLGRFAAARRDAAERHVEWVAGRDVAAERLDAATGVRWPDDFGARQHAAAALAYYRAAVVRLAGYSGDAAGRPRPAAGEGVPGEPSPQALPRHHRRWD
jgi:hypothetical protein